MLGVGRTGLQCRTIDITMSPSCAFIVLQCLAIETHFHMPAMTRFETAGKRNSEMACQIIEAQHQKERSYK